MMQSPKYSDHSTFKTVKPRWANRLRGFSLGFVVTSLVSLAAGTSSYAQLQGLEELMAASDRHGVEAVNTGDNIILRTQTETGHGSITFKRTALDRNGTTLAVVKTRLGTTVRRVATPTEHNTARQQNEKQSRSVNVSRRSPYSQANTVLPQNRRAVTQSVVAQQTTIPAVNTASRTANFEVAPATFNTAPLQFRELDQQVVHYESQHVRNTVNSRAIHPSNATRYDYVHVTHQPVHHYTKYSKYNKYNTHRQTHDRTTCNDSYVKPTHQRSRVYVNPHIYRSHGSYGSYGTYTSCNTYTYRPHVYHRTHHYRPARTCDRPRFNYNSHYHYGYGKRHYTRSGASVSFYFRF